MRLTSCEDPKSLSRRHESIDDLLNSELSEFLSSTADGCSDNHFHQRLSLSILQWIKESRRCEQCKTLNHWIIETYETATHWSGHYAIYQAHNAQNFVRLKNHYYWSLTSPDWCTSNLSLVSPFSSIFPSSSHWDQSIHKSAAYADRHKYHPIILTIIIWSLTFFTLTS